MPEAQFPRRRPESARRNRTHTEASTKLVLALAAAIAAIVELVREFNLFFK